jgi:hypothetical protein
MSLSDRTCAARTNLEPRLKQRADTASVNERLGSCYGNEVNDLQAATSRHAKCLSKGMILSVVAVFFLVLLFVAFCAIRVGSLAENGSSTFSSER